MIAWRARSRSLQAALRGPGDARTLQRGRDAALRSLVRHACTRVSHYRLLFEQAGVRPEDIRAVGDLGGVPLSTKGDLRDAPLASRLARGLRPEQLVRRTTEGSTGEPFAVYRTWFEERLLQAFRIRALRSLGLRVGDHRAVVRSPKGAPHPADRTGLQSALQRAGLFPETLVSALLPPDEIARRLREIRPRVIAGYAGAIAAAAEQLRDEAIEPGLRFACVGGEVSAPALRRRIAANLGAPVFDLYGASEFNLIAVECREGGGLHVQDDSVIVEVVSGSRPVGPGVPGEIVVTALHSRAMPFLRYRLGDRGVLEEGPCPCGLPFSRLRRVEGRTVEYLRLRDGRMLHPFEISQPLDDLTWVRRYQISQDPGGRVIVRIQPDGTHDAEQLHLYRIHIRERLGPANDSEVRLVTEIAPDPSGKFRTYRSAPSSRQGD